MTHVTCRLAAKNRDQLRNPTLGNRVRGASFTSLPVNNQVDGHSDVNQYRRVLARGCRCVELDVWDGDDGEPVIYHGMDGVHWSTKILFKDVLAAINESAFAQNDQLVILSLENHATPTQQVPQLQKRFFCVFLKFLSRC